MKIINFVFFFFVSLFPVFTQAQAQWQPKPLTTWQWQLTGTIDTTVKASVYNIDLFDAPQNTIDKLRSQGVKVICYFSAGSSENWRPDYNQFPAVIKGKSNGWSGEKWLDIRRIDLLSVMTSRLDLALVKNCDGVEADNVDGYTNSTGFPLKYADQIKYNTWLASEAHLRGLSIGLKNDLDQVKDLVSVFDFAINEQCFQYKECDLLTPFILQNKAVFGVEYKSKTSSFCPKANALKFSWLKKNLDLTAKRESCL